MTGQCNNYHHNSSQFDPQLARRRLAELAMAIAGTEDRVADTFERMALTRPLDASGLLARAAQARQCAMLERNRAVTFNSRR